MSDDRLSAVSSLVSIEEFERLEEEDCRSELVRGRVVREPPAGYEHCRLASRIDRSLGEFVEKQALGEVLTGEPGFVLSENPPTVRAPDVAFVAAHRVPEPVPVGFGRLAPDLAVEIVSVSNTLSEIHNKVFDYLDAGSRLVWVVDPGTRSVTAYRSRREIRILSGRDELDGGDVLPGFRFPLPAIFD